MATDTDILKTLERIEKILKGSSQTNGGGSKARIAGGGNNQSGGQGSGSQQRNNNKVFKATVSTFKAINASGTELNKTFIALNKTIINTSNTFAGMNRHMRALARAMGANVPSTSTGSGGGRNTVVGTAATSGGRRGSNPLTQSSNQAAQAVSNLGTASTRITTASMPLITAFKELGVAVAAMASDTLFLAARGASGSNLAGLYMDAAKAGMSLREYTQVLQDSTPAVARAKSFDDFADRLDHARGELSRLGVFGEDATKLGAAMANQATVLGVSQRDLDKSATLQTKTFENLRKSTMMTAEQFGALVNEMSETQEVQSSMLGLDQAERAGRLNNMVQMRTIGLQMGATAAASKALGDALIQQRNLTASQRFQSAGTIRQAGAITGMNSRETEELARLSRKKNLTAEEGKRAQELGARMQSGLERMQNSGNFNQEFIAEQLQSRLDESGIGRLLKASGNVELAKQSGDIANKDLGQGASTLVKGAGMLLTYAQGLTKNPAVMGILGALGASAAVFAGGKLMGGAGAAGGMMGRVGNAARGAAGMAGSAARGVAGMAGSAVRGAGSLLGAGARGVGSLAGALGQGATKMLPVLGASLRTIPIFGTIATMMVDGIGEAITGKVAAAFGGDGNIFSRIGNIVFASINGVFSGIAGMIDGVIGLFTDNGLNVQNAWDKFAVIVRSSFFGLLAKLSKMMTLGFSNPVSDYFQEAADNSNKVLETLREDQSATIGSIGENNKKKLEEQKATADKAAASIDSVTKVVNASAGVTGSTSNLAGQLVKDAAAIQALPQANAVPVVKLPDGTPLPDEVNRAIAASNAAVAASSSPTSTSEESSVSILKEMVGLLKTLTGQGETQAASAATVAREIQRNSGVDTMAMVQRLTTKL